MQLEMSDKEKVDKGAGIVKNIITDESDLFSSKLDFIDLEEGFAEPMPSFKPQPMFTGK